MKKLFSIFVILGFISNFHSQEIKLEDIMKGDAFIGNQPSNPSWSWDSKRIYFDWNPLNEPGNSKYFWEKGMTKPALLPTEEIFLTKIQDKEQNEYKIRYFIDGGNLYSFDTKTKKKEKIYQSSEYLLNLKVVSSSQIYFQKGDNLFLFNSISAGITQVTNFKSGFKDEQTPEKTFLETQQLDLFHYLKDKEIKQDWNSEKEKKLKEKFPQEYYFGKKYLENLEISNDGHFIFFRLSAYPEDLETQVEHHITNSGYTKMSKARDKVSDKALSQHELYILDIEKDEVKKISFSSLTNIRKAPSYLSLYPNFKEELDIDKLIVMHTPIFNKTGATCVIDVRSLDNKDRWICQIDLKNGQIVELEYQHDAAWIGGPGISEWNFEEGTLGFLADEESIYFQSEETGFSHLYSLQISTKSKKALTSGKWEVRNVSISSKKDCFYLSANKTHPGNREFYKLNLKSTSLSEIIVEEGANEISISPDENKLAVLFSTRSKPWELFYAENKLKATKIQITKSTTPEFEAVSWIKPEVVTFEAADKTKIYARLYKSEQIKKNGAAIIFVHGAGYLQNAHNFWSSYMREYMFHNLLVEKGYTVLDIDYRASDGYGRDFRTGIYRHMGGVDLEDQIDGKKYLIKNQDIDSNRVGIYGGSYGGFITLMALFTKPNQFTCGAALRSVTDWAHYNVEYTSNILNFPETDSEAYFRSSPINHCQNLNKPLLMLHGMVDDNVQFQDIVRLSQRLIELQKDNWELAVFPVEAHGFKEYTSWLDEYKRILKLFETNLK
jgi:dipeptidyl aminopeptidase/acylaminoacyl peptidase